MTDNPKRILRSFLFKTKWSYSIAILFIILSEIVTVQFPHVLGDFTDTLKHGRLTAAIVGHYAWLLLLIGIGYVILYGVGQFRNGQLGRRFEYQLRKRLFLHWEQLSTSYYRQRSIGDLLSHAMNDVATVREALSGGMNILTNAIFLLIAAIYMTFTTVSVKLTLVSMIPLVFVPMFIVWIGPRIRLASRKVQEGLSEMAAITEESFSAIRLIKATANETVESGRLESRVDTILHRQVSMFRLSALFQSMIPLMGSLSFSIALLYGGYMVIHQEIPLGAFVAFTLYLTMLITPLQQIGFVINNFQRASASLARLGVLLSEEPDIVSPEHPIDVQHVTGSIRVDLPAYRYPDGERPVLKNIRFTAQPGQLVGIVGRTASGKTTLANLFPRIFDPPSGTVFIDGYDVRELSLETLRRAIAYVPQDGFLFSTSIAENISFSQEACSQADIERAAREASIYEDIMAFKDGFETQIGERGVTLSGGQRQRTAIARAFLKDAPILIMDDSLSAVDMNTERKIIERIQAKHHQQTTLLIAHRLSAVRHADLILVLEDGALVEQGKHEELLERGGVYASIYALQQEEEAPA